MLLSNFLHSFQITWFCNKNQKCQYGVGLRQVKIFLFKFHGKKIKFTRKLMHPEIGNSNCRLQKQEALTILILMVKIQFNSKMYLLAKCGFAQANRICPFP